MRNFACSTRSRMRCAMIGEVFLNCSHFVLLFHVQIRAKMLGKIFSFITSHQIIISGEQQPRQHGQVIYIFSVAFSKLLETYKQQDLCPFFGLAIKTIVAFLVFFFINLLCHFCFCIWSKLSNLNKLMIWCTILWANPLVICFSGQNSQDCESNSC